MKLTQRACICGQQIVWGTTEKGKRVPLECALVWLLPKKGGKVRGLDSNGRVVVGDPVSNDDAQALGVEGLVRVRESHFARCAKEKDVRAAMAAKEQTKQLDEARAQAKPSQHIEPDQHPNAPSNPLGLHRKKMNLCTCGEPVAWVQLGSQKRAVEVDEIEVVAAPKGTVRGEKGAILAAIKVQYTDKDGTTKTRHEARLVVPAMAGQDHGAVLGRPLHVCAGGL